MKVAVDVDGKLNIPEALMEKYEEAMNKIDDEMVEQMKQEPDVDVNPSPYIKGVFLRQYAFNTVNVLKCLNTYRFKISSLCLIQTHNNRNSYT